MLIKTVACKKGKWVYLIHVIDKSVFLQQMYLNILSVYKYVVHILQHGITSYNMPHTYWHDLYIAYYFFTDFLYF